MAVLGGDLLGANDLRLNCGVAPRLRTAKAEPRQFYVQGRGWAGGILQTLGGTQFINSACAGQPSTPSQASVNQRALDDARLTTASATSSCTPIRRNGIVASTESIERPVPLLHPVKQPDRVFNRA